MSVRVNLSFLYKRKIINDVNDVILIIKISILKIDLTIRSHSIYAHRYVYVATVGTYYIGDNVTLKCRACVTLLHAQSNSLSLFCDWVCIHIFYTYSRYY